VSLARPLRSVVSEEVKLVGDRKSSFIVKLEASTSHRASRSSSSTTTDTFTPFLRIFLRPVLDRRWQSVIREQT
jgi:hypothetical protein